MAKQNGTLTYRVEQLEKQCLEIEKKVNEIMTNHLPHIREDISSLKTEVRLTAIINVGAIILGILVMKLLS